MEPHQFGQFFCTRDRAREAPFAFFYQPPSVGSLDQSLECDPDFSVNIFSSKHQFVRLQENNVQDFSALTLAPEHRCH